MDIFSLFLLCYLSYKNSVKAKLKDLNGILWGVFTVLSYMIFEAVGLFVVVSFFCRGEVDMSMLSGNNPNFEAVSRQFNDQVARAVMDNPNPIRQMTVILFGIGGYLFIRFLIDRKPTKKEPEIHWMDKIGKQ